MVINHALDDDDDNDEEKRQCNNCDINFQKSSLISQAGKPGGFHMLSSPISTPSPRQKADAEKKQREVEEAERRKIYAEMEGNICSKEEKPGYGGGKLYSEKERTFSEEEREREGEEEGGESEEEEEVATRYKEAASCQDVAQVFLV